MIENIGFLHYVVLSETSRGRRIVQLENPLTYTLAVNGLSLRVSAPKGFKSDLTSIPRLLWPLFPPDGQYEEAAVLHDYLYSLEEIPRWLCDAVFRHVMQYTGVPMWKRILLYWGVRIGGRWARRCSIQQSC